MRNLCEDARCPTAAEGRMGAAGRAGARCVRLAVDAQAPAVGGCAAQAPGQRGAAPAA